MSDEPRTGACPCGAALEQSGKGRPRKFCLACSGDKSLMAKAWRLAHPDRVEARNRARREWGGWRWRRPARIGDRADRLARVAMAMLPDRPVEAHGAPEGAK